MKIRTVVFGAGHLGSIHARLIQQVESVELVAIVDPSESIRQKMADQFGMPTYASLDDSLPEFDAAIIATPTEYHHEIAAPLAARGIHLLIEKPVTLTTSQARHLAQLADASGSFIQVGHVERFNPAFQQIAPQAGVPRFVQATRASGYTFRSIDVGVVLDLMIHDIDLVTNLAQSQCVDVRAIGYSLFGRHEDMAQARLEFENGFVANLTASRCHPQPQRQMDIFGTRGHVHLDLGQGRGQIVSCPDWLRKRQFDLDNVTEEQKSLIKDHLFDEVMKPVELQPEPVNAILCEQENWIEAIHGNAQLQIPLEAGATNLDIALRIVRQIETHAWSTDGRALGPLADASNIESAANAIPFEPAPCFTRAA